MGSSNGTEGRRKRGKEEKGRRYRQEWRRGREWRLRIERGGGKSLEVEEDEELLDVGTSWKGKSRGKRGKGWEKNMREKKRKGKAGERDKARGVHSRKGERVM